LHRSLILYVDLFASIDIILCFSFEAADKMGFIT
jgi:hypothetical protein